MVIKCLFLLFFWGGSGTGNKLNTKLSGRQQGRSDCRLGRFEREVAVETKAHGKLILATKKKRSKQKEITMNRLLLWKDVFFHLPFPKLSKQILDKDHFAMQTRLNLWMQLFVKTKNFSFKLRSLLSINQYNKRIPYKEECGVYGLRG